MAWCDVSQNGSRLKFGKIQLVQINFLRPSGFLARVQFRPRPDAVEIVLAVQSPHTLMRCLDIAEKERNRTRPRFSGMSFQHRLPGGQPGGFVAVQQNGDKQGFRLIPSQVN